MNMYHEARNDTSDGLARRSASLPLMPALMLAAVLFAGCVQVTRSGNAGQTQTQSATQSPSTGDGVVVNGSVQTAPRRSRRVPSRCHRYLQPRSRRGATCRAQHGQVLEILLTPDVQWGLTITDTDHALQGQLQRAGTTHPQTLAHGVSPQTLLEPQPRLQGSRPLPTGIHCTAVLEQAAFDVTVHEDLAPCARRRTAA